MLWNLWGETTIDISLWYALVQWRDMFTENGYLMYVACQRSWLMVIQIISCIFKVSKNQHKNSWVCELIYIIVSSLNKVNFSRSIFSYSRKVTNLIMWQCWLNVSVVVMIMMLMVTNTYLVCATCQAVL